MIEQKLRDGLWAAVADEPAFGFDPLVAADIARREVRRRRAVLTAGAATSMLVVGMAVAVAVAVGKPGDRGSTATAPALTEPAAREPTAGTPGPQDDPYGLRPAADRIAAHLRDVLPGVVPAARNVQVDPATFGQERAGGYTASPHYLGGPAFFDDDLGRAVVVVDVRRADIRLIPCASVNGNQGKCERRALAGGGSVTLFEWSTNAPDRRVRSATVERPDGIQVTFSAYTYDGFSRQPDQLVRAEFPVTDDQLVALATDPAFTL